MAGCIQNLTPWPKGVSGNPAGRPKGDISSEIARAVFENNAEAIYRGMARRLAKGDPRAFKVLAERAYGKVKQNVELDAAPWNVVVRYVGGRDVASLSDAELRERIEEFERELGMRLVPIGEQESVDVGEKRGSQPALKAAV
jgi:hypothetical protein